MKQNWDPCALTVRQAKHKARLMRPTHMSQYKGLIHALDLKLAIEPDFGARETTVHCTCRRGACLQQILGERLLLSVQ